MPRKRGSRHPYPYRSQPAEPVARAVGVRTSAPTGLADHIFISYAWEDRVLADWLTLRLTAAGYRVWCDRFKMLGGERFPEHIDDAIKHQTFRMLGLLSKHSLHKPNPVNERTLGVAIARERNIDFFIPLDLEGFKATDLNWMISSITLIPFTEWADGLQRVLKKLNSLEAPRPLADAGTASQAVLDALMSADVIREVPENVFTNCFPFRRIPARVRVYSAQFAGAIPQAFESIWAFHPIDERHVASFAPAPDVHGFSFRECESVEWAVTELLRETPTRHIVSNLLRQSVRAKLLQRGLTEDRESGLIYFPRAGHRTEAKLTYVPPVGRAEDLQATGARKYRNEVYRYHLAPTFRIRSDIDVDFWAQLTLRVFITDKDGKSLDAASAFSRRRALTTNWYNHQWLTRQLAVMQFLRGAGDTIQIGSGDGLIELEGRPHHGSLPVSINDKALARLRDRAAPVRDSIDDGLEEEADDD